MVEIWLWAGVVIQSHCWVQGAVTSLAGWTGAGVTDWTWEEEEEVTPCIKSS